jgi:uncharacterized protein (DUF4415 family)
MKTRSSRAKVDLENPLITAARWKGFRPSSDVVPHIVDAYVRSLGRPPEGDAPKTAVSIRLDRDALAKFKASGPGWQTRINELVVKAAAKLKPAKNKAR